MLGVSVRKVLFVLAGSVTLTIPAATQVSVAFLLEVKVVTVSHSRHLTMRTFVRITIVIRSHSLELRVPILAHAQARLVVYA